jgi:Tfp pilus assembly protein PilO
MSRDVTTRKSSDSAVGPGAHALRARAGRFASSRQRSLLGVQEIIALAIAALLVVAALASYLLFLRPQRVRLAELTEERNRLERQLQNARDEGQQSESTEADVEKILTSLVDFESRHLGENTQQSEWDVVGKLNELLSRHGLERNAKLSYTKFDVSGEGGRQSVTGASRPIQAVFPGIGISLTVEGSYHSLRRFITDVESDPRFIVINTVELEGITESGANVSISPDGTMTAPAPAQRGTLVSLRLDMAAYFRRGGS